MRRATKILLLVAAVAFVWAPQQARADGYVGPWVGAQWADGNRTDSSRGSYGVSAGSMGGGTIGGEFDFGITPNFLGTKNAFGANSVMTFMGNVIFGLPIGGTSGAGIRPYGTAGLGLLRSQYDGGNVFTVSRSNNDFAWDAGGGILGFFGQHVGMRGDIRYFRGTNDHPEPIDNVHFWRGSVGVIFR